jgi:hypothetical protein
VVIATVFLTIIGMTAGYVLGERHRRDTQSQQSQQGAGQSGSTTEQTATPVPSASGAPCPDAAQEAAAALGVGELGQVLMIKTKSKATVWICQDVAGHLYYQSHTLVKGQDLPLKQNFNGLFLPNVTSTDTGYVVVDQKGNRFVVTRERLQISFAATHKVESDEVASSVG